MPLIVAGCAAGAERACRRMRLVIRVLRRPDGRAVLAEAPIEALAACCLYVAAGRWIEPKRFVAAIVASQWTRQALVLAVIVVLRALIG